jgi:hypothetical protein
MSILQAKINYYGRKKMLRVNLAYNRSSDLFERHAHAPTPLSRFYDEWFVKSKNTSSLNRRLFTWHPIDMSIIVKD